MSAIEVDGKTLETDEEGDLLNWTEWTENAAKVLAKQYEIELTDAHWEIIRFLRDYYEEYQISPAVRVLTKAVGSKLGKYKGNTKYLYDLFPYGPDKMGANIAGLPKPIGCI